MQYSFKNEMDVDGILIGNEKPCYIIAEIGINHEGEYEKAIRMVDDAASVGCECVKFQCHVVEDEMIPNDVIPGNTTESIWEIVARCSLSGEQEILLKERLSRHYLHEAV